MWNKWKIWGFVLILLLTACSSNNSSDKSSGMDSGGSKEESAADHSESKVESSNKDTDDKKMSIQDQRKVIYTADLQLTIDNLQHTMERVRLMVEETGGYIVQSNTNRGKHEEQDGMIVARIPMNQFRPFLKQVKDLSKGSPQESVRGTDVTEEYVDLTSRLKAKELVRDRLESFMKNAQKTEDLLKISDDLANVQEEIEQIQGRLNLLKNQSDYSTVTIDLNVRNLKAEKLNTEDLNTWSKTKILFMDTVNFLISAISFVFVGLIGLAPVWLIIALVFYVLWRKKKGQKKKPESPTTMT